MSRQSAIVSVVPKVLVGGLERLDGAVMDSKMDAMSIKSLWLRQFSSDKSQTTCRIAVGG